MGDPGYYWFPGDYQRDTAHLSLVEDGAYRRLLDHYYSTSAPLPADDLLLYRIARAFTDEEQAAVRIVAAQFFPADEKGERHNRRADEEIKKRRAYIAQQSELAHRRWDKRDAKAPAKHKPRKMPRHKPTHMPTDMPPSPLPSPSPSPVPNQKSTKTARAKNVLLTDEEYNNLIAQHGQAGAAWMIERLDAYKEATGKAYRSDAGAIRSWVIGEYEKQRKNGKQEEVKKVKVYTRCDCGFVGNSRQVGVCDTCYERRAERTA